MTSNLSFFNKIKEELINICQANSYKGCDIVLTNNWSNDIHQFLPDNDITILQPYLYDNNKTFSQFINVFRPRYHFSSGKQVFYQRLPYRNLKHEDILHVSTTLSSFAPFTRFISLNELTESKDKNKKWLHAISIDPIIEMSSDSSEFTIEPVGTTDNPYVDVLNTSISKTTVKHTLSSETHDFQSKRSKLNEEYSNSSNKNTGSFFFGSMGVQNSKSSKSTNNTITTPSLSSKQLFIGNISRDVSDLELQHHFPNIFSIKRPKDVKSNYLFIDFKSHQDAVNVINESSDKPFIIQGKTINIGWANQSSSNDNSNRDSLVKMPSNVDCKTLFVGNIPDTTTNIDLTTLFPDSVSIYRPEGKNFAFIEFSTPEFARQVMTRHSEVGKEYYISLYESSDETAEDNDDNDDNDEGRQGSVIKSH